MSTEAVAATRLMDAFLAVTRASDPRREYRAWYRGTVKFQAADAETVDVVPDDLRMPAMGGIPLRSGIAGGKVRIAMGSHLMLGFESGDPSRPFAALWDGGTTTLQVTLVANKIELGGEGLLPLIDGAINGSAVDPFTGLQQWQLGNASTVVGVKR